MAGPDRPRAETRAVHSDLPPTSAATLSSSPSSLAAAWAMLACSTGGASIVKITWISLPSSSVTPAVHRHPWPSWRRPALASSKSDGRMPRMTLRPK